MIDFNKPMRSIKTGRKLYVNSNMCVVWDGDRHHAVDHIGGMCQLAAYNPGAQYAENIFEPKCRYQAQGDEGQTTDWLPSKEYHDMRPWKTVAWLVETDHGEDAVPRYTYEREEVK